MERFSCFVDANGVESERQKSLLLSTLDASTYGMLKTLAVPNTPMKLTMSEITGLMSEHFDTKRRLLFRSGSHSGRQNKMKMKLLLNML